MIDRAAQAVRFLEVTVLKRLDKKDTCLIAGVVIGLLTAMFSAVIVCGGFSGLRAVMKYAQVLHVIRSEFVGEYDLGDVTDDAMAGAIDGLDDMWSYYMDAETYAAYQDYSANRYQGIGVTITKDDATGGFAVLAVTKDGPAQAAGIVPGDVILAVDGIDVTEEDTAYLRDLIQADYGQDAVVTVLHEDGTTEDFAVSCEAVYSSPVEYAMLDGGVGYVALYNFRQGAGADAVAAVETLIEEGAESLVFDVRSNPGGQVTELTELLDYLLPEGDIFVRADKNGREAIETSDAACIELPMAVIVNGDSYSAAEYFAAALREYDWATVVGEPTTGKARSQVTVELPDGSAVHISKYTYLTPLRNDLYAAGGLTPDVEAVLTEEERTQYDTGWLEPADDAQVQAAIRALEAPENP